MHTLETIIGCGVSEWNLSSGILIKPLNNSDGNGDKSEKSKVQEDLKEIMDQPCSSTFDTDAKQKRNPLHDFFVDEVKLVRKLLNIVRADMDLPSFDDNEVRQFIFHVLTRKRIVYPLSHRAHNHFVANSLVLAFILQLQFVHLSFV